MPLLVLLGLFIIATQLPAFLAKRVMNKYSSELDDLPGSGRELFEHLKQKFKLKDLKLNETTLPDHFNPLTNTVNISKHNLERKSLTAVAVVTHEFSHALQHHEGSKLLRLRTRLAKFAAALSQFASLLALGGLGLAFVMPRILYFVGVVWLVSFIFSVLIHIITLPVEIDASYNKALPILTAGEYLKPADLATVRKILGICAYTYVTQALSSFIFLLLALLRRGRVF